MSFPICSGRAAASCCEGANLEVLDKFIEAWAERDLEALLKCTTHDFVYVASVGAGPGATYAGHRDVRAGTEAMWRFDSGLEGSIIEKAVYGDRGVLRWAYHEPRLAAPSAVGCDLFEFRDGLVKCKDAYRKVPHMTKEDPLECKPHSNQALRAGIGCSIRFATEADATPLLELMRQLAEFEGYADDFCVRERDLLARGLGDTGRRQFTAIVAESDLGELWGYAVVLEMPFTYDLRPTMLLKELLVRQSVRGHQVGAALMARVVEHARQRRCPRLQWDVLPGNESAKRFYRRFGGAPVTAWERWGRPVG